MLFDVMDEIGTYHLVISGFSQNALSNEFRMNLLMYKH